MNHNMRLATIADSENILRIYAPYISDTAITFETEVPNIKDFSARVEKIIDNYPFLAYEIKDEIVGYAYSSQHRERAAYLYDVDVSIYILPEHHGTGIAYKLYKCLFSILSELGYINAYAALTEPNIKSMKFHQKFNFTKIGTHHKTGYKFGKWHDVTWLEKTINIHNTEPKKILSIKEISSECLKNIFNSYNLRQIIA
jgi:phosphinothricin acetyltransferase